VEKVNKEDILEYFAKENGFSKYNKMQIDELTEEESILSCEITEDSLNPSKIVHGGLVFGLADTAMGTLAYMTGRGVVTVDSTINYLRPTKGNKITCIAKPIKIGKTLGVYKATIYNEDGTETAYITGTYIFLNKDINK